MVEENNKIEKPIDADDGISNSLNFDKCIYCLKENCEHLISCIHPICDACFSEKCTEDGSVECPTCKKTSSTKVDNVLLGLGNMQVAKTCAWCEEAGEHNTATGHCPECTLWLCPECIRGHNRMPAFRSHAVDVVVQSNAKDERRCGVHPREALDLFCETCSALTCRDCQLSNHQEHRHQWVGEKVKEVEQDVRKAEKGLTEKEGALEEAHEGVTKAAEQLDTVLASTSSYLKESEEMYVTELRHWFSTQQELLTEEVEKRRKDINSAKESLDGAKHDADYIHGFITRLLSSSDPAGVIQVSELVSGRVSELTQQMEGHSYPWAEACTKITFVQNRDPASLAKHVGHLRFAPYDVTRKEGVTGKRVPLSQASGESGDEGSEGENRVNGQVSSTVGNFGRADLLAPNHNPTDPSLDYCCVCYDGGSLICCSGCDHVYHVDCHIPRLEAIPRGDWFCTLCMDVDKLRVTAQDRLQSRGNRLTGKERKTACRILLSLLDDINSAEFPTPTDPALLGTADMMDLPTVRRKLEEREYPDLESFVGDLQLVFDKSRTFLNEESPERRRAHLLETKFKELVAEFLPYKSEGRRPARSSMLIKS